MTKKEDIIKQYLNNPKARSALAQSMISPIKRRLNYSSIAKNMFTEIKPIFIHKDYWVFLEDKYFVVTFDSKEVMNISLDLTISTGLEGNPIRDELLDLLRVYDVLNE